MIRLLILLLLCSPVFAGQVINSYIKYPSSGGGPLDLTALLSQEFGVNGPTGADPINWTTSSISTSADHMLIVMLFVQLNGTDLSNLTTVSGGSLTWNRVASQCQDNGTYYSCLESWFADNASGGSMTIDIDATTASSSTRVTTTVAVFESENASTTVGGTIGGEITASGAFSMTLSSAPASSSYVLASRMVADGGTSSTATPGSGYTEQYDETEAFGNFQTQYRTSSTSTTVDWVDVDDSNMAGFTAGISGALAIEIVEN